MPRLELEDELRQAWQEMSEITRPKCDECLIPRSCCSPEYCEMAIKIAQEEWGISLVRTEHPKLPLMGTAGCIAPPHVRPLCTLHVCEGTFWKAPMAWKKNYLKLRDRLSRLESEKDRRKT